MAHEPLTTAGVQQKTTDLYALPDVQLLIQADLVRADFRAWLKDNFILDSSQENYLDNIDDRWIQSASCETGTAMENRLPIDLQVIGTPFARASKLIKKKNNTVLDDSPGGGFQASGTLSFEIIYSA